MGEDPISRLLVYREGFPIKSLDQPWDKLGMPEPFSFCLTAYFEGKKIIGTKNVNVLGQGWVWWHIQKPA